MSVILLVICLVILLITKTVILLVLLISKITIWVATWYRVPWVNMLRILTTQWQKVATPFYIFALRGTVQIKTAGKHPKK